MVMVKKIILDNNQYPWVCFKTHWVATGVKTFDIFYATTDVWEDGILFYKAMVCRE
jgi:hypothetical protein